MRIAPALAAVAVLAAIPPAGAVDGRQFAARCDALARRDPTPAQKADAEFCKGFVEGVKQALILPNVGALRTCVPVNTSAARIAGAAARNARQRPGALSASAAGVVATTLVEQYPCR